MQEKQDKIKEAVKSKSRGKLSVGVHWLQDNVPVSTAQVVVAETANQDLNLTSLCFMNLNPTCQRKWTR